MPTIYSSKLSTILIHKMNTVPASIFFIFFYISFSPILYAQTVRTYNTPNTNCYSEIVFEEKAINPKGVIVLEVHETDIKSYVLNNRFTSSGLFNDYNFLYIRVVKKESDFPLSCYEQIINVNSYVHHIEKSSYYFIDEVTISKENSENNYGAKKQEFNIINFANTDLQSLKMKIDNYAINKRYNMPIVYSASEEDSRKMVNYKNNFDIGLNYTPFFLMNPKLGLKKTAIGILGLSLKKNISNTTTLIINLDYSIANKNKTVEKLQTANSKDTINSHALFGAEIQFRKYFNTERPLRYFASVGLGYYSLTDVKLKRKKTSVSMKNSEDEYFTPLIDFGLEYRLSPVLKVYSSLPVKYFINNGGAGSLNTLGFGLNIGLSFTLNPSNISKRN